MFGWVAHRDSQWPRFPRLVRRALDVWQREGLRALALRIAQRLRGWRLDHDLLGSLDTELPERLVVGEGNVLFLGGWCFHPRSRVARLQIVVNGVAHRVVATKMVRPDVFAAHFPERDPRGHSYASGFSTMVSFSRDECSMRVDLYLQATLRNGATCSRKLGSIRLEPESGGDDLRSQDSAGRGPRIAICMTTYNPPVELFARQTQSIRNQTLQDWVCLISDDCSDPDVFEEIRRIAGEDSRFRVFRGSTRVGFYHNFERCLSLVPAGVEFVTLSDHDDRWHHDKLETLLASFDEDTTLVYSDMNIIDELGNVLANTYWTTRPNRYDDLASLLIANTITGAASMFRATLLKHLLPFPQKLGEPFHDHWLACLALSMGRVSYVDRPLYDYVQHSSNVLGHYAPARVRAWAKVRGLFRSLSPRDARRRIRTTLAGWRAVYHGDVLRVRLIASVLELRCAAALTPEKARHLRRLARLDESWWTTIWLVLRDLKGIGRVTETLRGEHTLLKGLLWGWYARLRSRVAPRGVAGRRVTSGPAKERDTRGIERVRLIEQKIAPLRLRMSHTAPRRMNLLIPTIDFAYFFGGYIAKFNLARRLAEEGRRVRLVAVDYCPGLMSTWERQVRAYEGLEGVFDCIEVARAFDREQALEVSPDDSFIASTWWTAHIAHQATESLGRRRFLYLIQEYEPFTFPMGTMAALARQTYDFPHFAIFSTELLRDYFRERQIGVFAQGTEAGERDSVSFANAITPVGPVKVEDIANRWPRRLLFYARPEAHAARNMFELGVLGLSEAIAAGHFEGRWEFHGLGAVGEAGRLSLGGGAQMRVLPRQSQGDYRELLRGHDLGLSLMYTPHPSLVPIEMASAGMLVVTNSCENKTGDRLAAISSNMIVVEPTVDGVTRGLREAVAAIGDYERRVEGSRVNWSTNWDDSFNEGFMKRIGQFIAASER